VNKRRKLRKIRQNKTREVKGRSQEKKRRREVWKRKKSVREVSERKEPGTGATEIRIEGGWGC
jgi:hypothetical protein